MSEPKLGGKFDDLPSQFSLEVERGGGVVEDENVSVGKREGSVTLPAIHFCT